MPWTNMRTARKYASALQINPNQALIIGGYDENGNDLKTTELISSSGSEAGKDFPVTIAWVALKGKEQWKTIVAGKAFPSSDPLELVSSVVFKGL